MAPMRLPHWGDDDAKSYKSRKTGPKFLVIIPDEIFGRLPIRSRFSQLLCHPAIGWRACYIYMDDLAWLQFDDEESKERTEEEVRHLQAHHRPTPLPHDCAKTFSSSVYGLVLDESASYTSESSVYSLEYPAWAARHGYAPPPTVDCLLPCPWSS